ncbi:unnamed protein product [Brachionus calyciflorus]|uniref:Vinculin n=1 Tax=Brachionus calyciflorus TaxID=104777 RepID=A0A813SSK6_9BILA|nr:unnamed protein product [Brachionus calyciflorus]
MPVFHTKTIESILEPVAQQISKLVILHDDADNGNLMPDLSLPVQVVQQAADNLIRVGHETCTNSDDSLLKRELPLALIRVEEACKSLQEASVTLKSDPKSPFGKRKLIEGERGILQGVSAILLSFDESEVRKIVHLCKQVIEYLFITELIEKMDDLVTYVKNLTPVLTRMTREVDAREKELTHQEHRNKLVQHLEQVKSLTPSFISSIKIYLLTLASFQQNDSQEKQVLFCIQDSKDFLIKRINYEIKEIIRILQLTSYDEDEWATDDFTFLRQKLNSFEVKLKPALNWLNDENTINDSSGEKFLRGAIDESVLIANKMEHPFSEKILNSVETSKDLLQDISTLIHEEKRNSNLAKKTSEILKNELVSLHEILIQSINSISHVCTKPSPTLSGKFEQAAKWLSNPSLNDNGLGETAAQSIIGEAIKILQNEPNCEIRQDLEKLIHQSEYLMDEFRNLKNDIKVDRLIFQNATKKAQESLNILVKKINRYYIQKVADDFLDINDPLKKLSDIVINSKGKDNVYDKYNERSIDFLNHSQKLCDTAKEIALSTSQVKNKQTIELINELTKRIVELGPQVVNTGFLALKFTDNKSCLENFELMQKQWQINVQKLQKLIDDIIDCESFIIACEKSIIKETYQTQAAVLEKNSSAIVTNALNIVRRTNRIIEIAGQEAENSEDSFFVEKILIANDNLKKTLPVLIQSAKFLAIEPSNKENYLVWASSNEKLIDAISNVRESVSNQDLTSNRSSLPNEDDLDSELSNLENLKIDEDMHSNGYIMPKYRAIPVSRPTPLPDLIEENENEFPEPQNNQPILLAAHDLHYNINQWYSTDNDMIAVAKRITFLMARLSELVRAENGTKKDLIATAKQLADESQEICRIARLLANDCTDKRMKMSLLQVCDRIPTIGTQLKILSTVKATMLGVQGSKEDEEATEMLIVNAQNLNASVKATVRAAKSASIKLRPDSNLKMKWIRKKSFGFNYINRF